MVGVKDGSGVGGTYPLFVWVLSASIRNNRAVVCLVSNSIKRGSVSRIGGIYLLYLFVCLFGLYQIVRGHWATEWHWWHVSVVCLGSSIKQGIGPLSGIGGMYPAHY